MKTADHLFIGNSLGERYLKFASAICRRAFVLGNIFPDFNFFTYLRGFFSQKNVRGHNFENSVAYIRKMTEKLNSLKNFSIYDYFRLGELTHYTVDSFTFPHNSCFQESLKHHIVYEEKLHNEFQKFVKNNELPEHIIYLDKPDLWVEFSKLHFSYLQNSGTYMWDIKYILKAVHITMDILIIFKSRCISQFHRRAA